MFDETGEKMMKITNISDMKANAANLYNMLGFDPMFVTQNGRNSLVVQTHDAYEFQQEKMAFMELIIKAQKDVDTDSVVEVDDFLSAL
jgi:PHD/YefM family antitoxin component YafN of YafNO toxin-antitoxin module